MSRLWRAYVAAIEALCIAGVAVVLIVGICQVVARYALGASLYWSEELMRYVMMWIVAVGAGLSYTRGQFLGMRMLADRLPPSLRRGADLVSALLMLIFLAVIVWYGFQFSWGTRQQSAVALGFSMFWVHVAVVVGAALLWIHILLNDMFGFGREAPHNEHVMGAEEAL